MKLPVKRLRMFFLLSLLFLLSSCLGLGFDIVLNNNGSGTMALEYRVSKSLDSLGRLDGNESWNTIPVGRADFERTLDRVPGLRLLSFSTREEERDMVVNSRIEFETIQALLAFLDAGGRRSYYRGDARSGHLTFTLSEGAEGNNSGINRLLSEVFDSYSVNMTMTFPNRRTVSYSFPIYEILSSPEEIIVEFNW